MGETATYIFMSGAVLMVLYIVYKWLLARENQPSFNRGVLLVFYLIASLTPAMSTRGGAGSDGEKGATTIETLMTMFNTQKRATNESEVMAVENAVTVAGPAVRTDYESKVPGWMKGMLWVWLSGCAATACVTVAGMVKLCLMIRRGRKIRGKGFTVVINPEAGSSPFSWWRYVVTNGEDSGEVRRMILRHELAHRRLLHGLDVALAQCACIVLWYNPASWLMRNELKSVHEYQADDAVLRAGTDARAYQLLLVRKATGGRYPALANSLNHSKLKSRIGMMCNKKSRMGGRLKVIAAIPAVVLAVMCMHVPAVAKALEKAREASLHEEPEFSFKPDAKLPTSNGDSEEVIDLEAISVVAYKRPAEGEETVHHGKADAAREEGMNEEINEAVTAETTVATEKEEPQDDKIVVTGTAIRQHETDIKMKIFEEAVRAMDVDVEKMEKGQPAIIADGVQITEKGLNEIDVKRIKSISVFKNISQFPDGVIYIELEKDDNKPENDTDSSKNEEEK